MRSYLYCTVHAATLAEATREIRHKAKLYYGRKRFQIISTSASPGVSGANGVVLRWEVEAEVRADEDPLIPLPTPDQRIIGDRASWDE